MSIKTRVRQRDAGSRLPARSVLLPSAKVSTGHPHPVFASSLIPFARSCVNILSRRGIRRAVPRITPDPPPPHSFRAAFSGWFALTYSISLPRQWTPVLCYTDYCETDSIYVCPLLFYTDLSACSRWAIRVIARSCLSILSLRGYSWWGIIVGVVYSYPGWYVRIRLVLFKAIVISYKNRYFLFLPFLEKNEKIFKQYIKIYWQMYFFGVLYMVQETSSSQGSL